MRAGELNRRVTFQSRGTAVDSVGQQVTTWTDLIVEWAKIEALNARELFAAQAVQNEVSHRFTIRYRTEIANPVVDGALRIIYAGRLFNVSGAMNIDERNRVIEILASEGLNDG